MEKIRIVVVLFFTLFLVAPVSSRDKSDSETSITGVWQFCLSNAKSSVNGDVEVRTLPVFKILSQEGLFSNLYVNCKGGVSSLTGHGSYIINKDGTYTEKVVKSYLHMGLDGKDNVITYRIEDNKFLYLKFYITFPDGTLSKEPTQEVWIKVDPVNPKEIDMDLDDFEDMLD